MTILLCKVGATEPRDHRACLVSLRPRLFDWPRSNLRHGTSHHQGLKPDQIGSEWPNSRYGRQEAHRWMCSSGGRRRSTSGRRSRRWSSSTFLRPPPPAASSVSSQRRAKCTETCRSRLRTRRLSTRSSPHSTQSEIQPNRTLIWHSSTP